MKRSREAEGFHLVVKIGGSLMASPLLSAWLEALRQAPFRVTVAPGGGRFADSVREAQRIMGFSDAAAHHMALLAMEQYAEALASLDETLACAETPEEAEAAHKKGAVALWRPLAMTRAATHIPKSWDMTSDSLAAWYAARAKADALLLVKSVDARSSADLAAEGVVDPLFARYAERLAVFVAGPADAEDAARILRNGGVPGAKALFTNPERKRKIAS